MPRAGIVAALAGLAAAAVVGSVVAPLGPTTVDPDASASVLYFERLTEGVRLEAFVPTTPKPLLTLVDGLAWAATGDWRTLTWIAVVVLGLAAAFAALFVWRAVRAAVGPIDRAVGPAEGDPRWAVGAMVGSAFIVVALAAWSDLVLEVSRANSLVPAIACWAAAGAALVGPRRRTVVAGIALLLGGLVRFETLAIVVGILGAALLLRLAEAGRGRRLLAGPVRWSRADVALVVGLGALAVPIACVHDLLLAGDPFYWTGVPARYTGLYAPSVGPVPLLAYLPTLGGHLAREWPLLLLAAVGVAAAAARRAIVPLVGLGSLAVGMVALLCGLAVRGIYISNRYYEPLDLALLALAALGIGALGGLGATVLLDVARPGRSSSSAGGAVAMIGLGAMLVVSFVGGAVVMGPPAPWDPVVTATLEPVRAASIHLQSDLGRLAELVRTPDPAASGPPALVVSPGAPPAAARSVLLFVPSSLRSRFVVETGAPLTAVGDTLAAFVGRPPWAGLHAGQWLYHDPAVDRPPALTRALDAVPPDLAGATARTAWSDASTGVRLLRIDAPR